MLTQRAEIGWVGAHSVGGDTLAAEGSCPVTNTPGESVKTVPVVLSRARRRARRARRALS